MLGAVFGAASFGCMTGFGKPALMAPRPSAAERNSPERPAFAKTLCRRWRYREIAAACADRALDFRLNQNGLGDLSRAPLLSQ
ncbi:hypothetical protein RPC_3970 [Rhodopseudomonas palustris BisB18]|uniref:Uncharacterized protein n=1 Tax=Rhodopseudomonas palustris (strain BisB18) TaxID=316056 RepID=Q20ZE0_RHOPB